MIMTDLFNRNRDGSKELEDLTGQWYASSPFRLIETEIRFATDEVARLVSQEVVKEAAEAYDEDEKPELVAAVRLPVQLQLQSPRYNHIPGSWMQWEQPRVHRRLP